MQKLRNNVYKLQDMEPGDRFYIAKDKKKNLLELDYTKPFEAKKAGGYWKHVGNCRKVNPQPGQLQVEPHLKNTFVVFLRNINELQKETLAQ